MQCNAMHENGILPEGGPVPIARQKEPLEAIRYRFAG